MATIIAAFLIWQLAEWFKRSSDGAVERRKAYMEKFFAEHNMNYSEQRKIIRGFRDYYQYTYGAMVVAGLKESLAPEEEVLKYRDFVLRCQQDETWHISEQRQWELFESRFAPRCPERWSDEFYEAVEFECNRRGFNMFDYREWENNRELKRYGWVWITRGDKNIHV